MSLNDLSDRLQETGSPERAVFEKNYLKSDKIHWGNAFKTIASAVRPFVKGMDQNALYDLADQAWHSGVFDLMIAATDLLKSKKVAADDRLWQWVKAAMKQVDGWALADRLAKLAERVLKTDSAFLQDLISWRDHDRLWYRRAVLVFSLHFAKKDVIPDELIGTLELYASDKEWFIQKAIGWFLRDASLVHPDFVREFVSRHETVLKAVAKKEALRKLPKIL